MFMLFLSLNELVRRVVSHKYLTLYKNISYFNIFYRYIGKNSTIFKGLAEFSFQYLNNDLQASAEIWSMTSQKARIRVCEVSSLCGRIGRNLSSEMYKNQNPKLKADLSIVSTLIYF